MSTQFFVIPTVYTCFTLLLVEATLLVFNNSSVFSGYKHLPVVDARSLLAATGLRTALQPPGCRQGTTPRGRWTDQSHRCPS